MSLPYDDLPLPLLLASQPNPNLNRSLNLSIRSGRPITTTAENNNNGGGGHQPNRKKKKKKSKSQKRYEAWERYIQDESLAENWERFLHDLGLGDFKSKTQCRKKLRGVWINIVDFLAAVRARDAAAMQIQDGQQREWALAQPVDVLFFDDQRALSVYTRLYDRFFPMKRVQKESPLKLLLAQIRPPYREVQVRQVRDDDEYGYEEEISNVGEFVRNAASDEEEEGREGTGWGV